MIQQYCPDPEDDDLVFNLPRSNGAVTEQGLLEAESSSDDEAPEDIPFIDSKSSALAVIRAEEKSKIDAHLLKKKRLKQKEAKLLEEKEAKAKRLEALASKKLPDSLLQHISEQQSLNPIKKTIKKQKNNFSGTHLRFENEHYIPIASEDVSTEFNVAILGSKKWKNKFSKPGHSASKNFRHQALYNSKIRRVTVQTLQQTRTKQEVSGKSAQVGPPSS